MPAYDWERVYGLLPKFLQNPQRLGLVASVGLHGLIFLTILLPSAPPRLQQGPETVDLVTLAPEQEALLPSLTPLVPDELPDLSELIAGLEQEITPPPFRFDDLPPLPPLTPLPNFSYLPPPVVFPPTSPSLQLPPRPSPLPLPTTLPATPNLPGNIAVAPDLVEPSPIPEESDNPENTVTAPTGDQQALSGLSRWITQARSSLSGGTVSLDFTGRVEPVYPSEACSGQLQGRAAVAVLVTPEGRLASTSNESGFSQNPQLIRSSGFPVLDQVAVRTVAGLTFPGSEQYQALLYTLDFVYDPAVCGEPAPTPSPTPTPTPSPTVSPSPSPPTRSSPAPDATVSPAPTTPPPNRTVPPKPAPN